MTEKKARELLQAASATTGKKQTMPPRKKNVGTDKLAEDSDLEARFDGLWRIILTVRGISLPMGEKKKFYQYEFDRYWVEGVAVELDGKMHLREKMFESDRTKGNLAVIDGIDLFRITSKMLADDPERWILAIADRIRARRNEGY